MKKKWDRIGDVGKATGGFSKGAKAEKGVRGEIRSLPTYKPSGNVKCRNCGRWKIGHIPGDGGGGGLKCLCEKPDFPNVSLEYSVKMQDWHLQWLNEAYRVLQPNGIIKAFSGTRTYHRLAAAMEQAGFVDIRLEAWCYGSGFPKSLNIGKALDKAAGVEREVVETRVQGASSSPYKKTWGNTGTDAYRDAHLVDGHIHTLTAPATEEAKLWDGWGTALKPGWEPVLVGRKPTL